ncbi:glycosyl hydrolase 53 family protein [Phocaeicola paurosaccharolyticus]|jgi:arabinogalactan endo-1,4-beta-galactosidase|uniref:glycoside hydrolase family 53 protein n=1 Tax=Phocaeicola paurosaccharolyticus TaxID=732242 RepID=UPI002FE25992
MQFINIFLSALLVLGAAACDDDKSPSFPDKPTYEMSGFAKGADVSWVTEMESVGTKFYDANGKQTECMTLLRDYGMNSIRLRVWVNPEKGWCNKSDVIAKAWRANKLGMRIMIDFHYSDSWADPGQQTKPAAWVGMSMEELKVAVADHTKDVLQALKDKGITPEWVQVGNETGNGMLWEEGKAADNMKQYAELNNAGYDAVKSVFSDAKVIVHLQEGNKNGIFRWLFDGLKENGGKWDVIGMSLYPESATWQTMNSDCLNNIKDMITRYGCEVMMCEVGMPWNEAEACKAFLTDLITKCKSVDKCLGVFYWEPQCINSWNGYSKGAFDNTGKPTVAMDAFKE